MSMSDTQDDDTQDDDTTGAIFPGQMANVGQPQPSAPGPQEGADLPGAHAPEGPPDDRPEAIRQRQRDFVPNLLKGLRDKAQSNYPQQEQTEGTSGPRKAIGAAMEGANQNYPENEQQGGGAQAPAMIMRYLAGADANPQLTQQAEQGAVQQLGQVADDPSVANPSTVHLMALHLAAEKDPEAGYAVQQTYRASYNASMGHAHVALAGAGGKPPDLAAAADAATKAASYVLDGTETTFTPNGTGVTATVKYPGNKQPQQVQLTLPQFNQYTDIGDVNGGQYDALHENGAALQKIAQGPGKPIQGAQQQPAPGGQQQPAPGGQQPAPGGQQPAQGAAPAPQPGATPAAPGGAPTNPANMTVDQAAAIPPSNPSQGELGMRALPPPYQAQVRKLVNLGYDQKLAMRAVTAAPFKVPEQMKMLQAQEQEGVTNQQNQDKIDTGFAGKQAAATARTASAQTTADARRDVATTQAGSAANVANIRGNFLLDAKNVLAATKTAEGNQKMELELLRQSTSVQNQQMRSRVTMAAKFAGDAASSGQEMSPQQAQFVSDTAKALQQPAQVPQAQTPRAGTPQAQTPQGPSAPQPGEKVVNGVRYTRGPNGEAVRVPGQ